MKLKLVIGDKIYSTWSLRPWLLLKYFNIPFNEVQIKLRNKNTKKTKPKSSGSLRAVRRKFSFSSTTSREQASIFSSSQAR